MRQMEDKQNIRSQDEIAVQAEYAARIRAENDRYEAETGTRRRAFVLTFGCQQNEADSETLAGMSKQMGYELCEKPEDADLILVNTCAIREHAEKKALSIIGQYKHLKAKNPALLIGVCGCMVTQEHRRDEIKHRYPYVDFTFGTSSLFRLPELIAEKLARGKRLFCRLGEPQESAGCVSLPCGPCLSGQAVPR